MTDSKVNHRIGYRVLYDAKGCSIKGHDEYHTAYKVADKYDVQLYFGPSPKHGIQILTNHSKYLIPGTQTNLGGLEFTTETDGSSGFGPFFLELVASVEIDKKFDSQTLANDLLLEQAESRKEEFKKIIDLVAGIIGLRFQRQFVFEPYNENVFAWVNDKPLQSIYSPAYEILEDISINENGIKYLEDYKNAFSSLSEVLIEKYSLIFYWLLKAWHERDPVHAFIALFVPLESLLKAVTNSKMSAEEKSYAKSIRNLIKKHSQGKSKCLIPFFNKLISRAGPTLDDLFVELAESIKMKGWKADIEAFKKFKSMRNALVHGSATKVQDTTTVGVTTG